MTLFHVSFSKKAEKDFCSLDTEEQRELGVALKVLEDNPFPFKKKIKKIKGTSQSLYRLRVELRVGSYRVFYTLLKPNQVILLRIVPKKDADRVLSNLL